MRRWAGTDRSISGRYKPRPSTHQGCQPGLRLSKPASAGTAAAGTALPSAQPVKPTLVHLLTNPEWERQWDLCSYDPTTRPPEAVGRLPRDTIESSTRTVVPWPFGLWIVIVPLDAPGLVGRRDDPCPGSTNSARASPRESPPSC